MRPWILHDHDFLLSKGRNLHFHYLSVFVFLTELKDSVVRFRICCWCSLASFFPQLTLLANMTLANQWTLKLPASEAVHHIMTFDPNDRNYLYLMTSHHVSISRRVPAPVSAWLFILLSSVADLFMSAWKSTRLATIRPHFASSESPSPQFSWTHTYFAATCADRQWVFPAAFSKQYAP